LAHGAIGARVDAMKIVWLSVSALALCGLLISSVSSLSGCVLPSSSTDGGTTPTGDGGALGSKTSGTGCGTDPTTGVTLCIGATECPTVSVDPSVFPECGFYFSGGSVYLACLCSNYLCPIGRPANCDQAAALLQSTNEGTVCGEASNNACSEVSVTSGGGGGTTPVEAGASADDSGSCCDESCASMCAGEPDCIQGCGC
jgi:hypothetical protein